MLCHVNKTKAIDFPFSTAHISHKALINTLLSHLPMPIYAVPSRFFFQHSIKTHTTVAFRGNTSQNSTTGTRPLRPQHESIDRLTTSLPRECAQVVVCSGANFKSWRVLKPKNIFKEVYFLFKRVI